MIETLIRVLPIEVNAWDRFSIRQRHFIHDPVTPVSYTHLTLPTTPYV